MNPTQNITLPPGHQSVENGDPASCPFLQIKHKTEQKFNENVEKKIEKNDSDSDLSDDEAQGTQGSCPFMPSFKKRNPDLAHLAEGYE